jgi:endonuclease/exonuclease/phosphatase (EEP) superfamily protein YafD
VQYVIAALLLALVLSVLRRDRWVLLAVALGAANLVPVVPLFLQPPQAVLGKSGHRLRLMSFNVFGFNRQYARMLEYVRRERPDVLVLLEITPEWLPAFDSSRRTIRTA